MAKLPRVFHRVFGSGAGPTDVGQFGSFAAGAPAYSANIDTIMGLPSWLTGWLTAVVGTPASDPFLEDENAVDLVHSQQIGYILQAGIPEWDNQTPYYTGSFCTRGGLPFVSLQDANSNKDPLTQPTWWQPYDSTRTGMIMPFAGVTVPSGYGLCDGSAISRTTFAALFNALNVTTTGNTVNGSNIISGMASTAGMQANVSFISGPGIPLGAYVTSVDSSSQVHISSPATATGAAVALAAGPWGTGDGATTFNKPDMRSRTIVGAGTGTGLTGRNIAGLFGEETHVLSNAELPAHTHSGNTGGQSNDHVHNIVEFSGGSGGLVGVQYDSNGVHVADQATGGVSADHSHAFTTGAGTGGGGAHNNIQPSVACPYVIKY